MAAFTDDKSHPWQFFVTFLGWLSDPFKWLSDLQLGDKKVTLNHLVRFVYPSTGPVFHQLDLFTSNWAKSWQEKVQPIFVLVDHQIRFGPLLQIFVLKSWQRCLQIQFLNLFEFETDYLEFCGCWKSTNFDTTYPNNPCMLYLPTFTTTVSHMWVNIPYMDDVGYGI